MATARSEHRSLLSSALIAILPVALGMVAIAVCMAGRLQLSGGYVARSLAVFGAGAALMLKGLSTHHPFASLGPGNAVTLTRGALVVLLAALIGESPSGRIAAAAVVIAAAACLLDGADGWLARRSSMASAFGARFDMETDAVLVAVLATLAWQFDKAGAWVLGAGGFRYVYLAAGMAVPVLRRPLPPSPLRKTIAIAQIIALITCLSPAVSPALSARIAAVALVALTFSFLQQGFLACRNSSVSFDTRRIRTWYGWARIGVAVLLLNAALTFYNVWPTLGIHWQGELSVEVAALVLLLCLSNAWLGPTSPRVLAALCALLVVFVLGRYGEVTAPALYGREVNLYWDVPQLASVTGMLLRVESPWRAAAVCAGLVAALAALYFAVRWSLRTIDGVLRTHRMARRIIGAGAAALVVVGVIQWSTDLPAVPRFSIPVSRTYGGQLVRTFDALSSRAAWVLPPSPPLQSSLAALEDADVLLVFSESLGRVIDDRPEFSQALGPARARLAAALQETHRSAVSAYVRSPTFGGHSVLAHLSLLSGIEVRDPGRYALLMTQRRPTLVSVFKAHGYRTVDVMPGMRQRWPEGAFYGFDEIYDASKLDYRGPEFGWWRIPDQFSLAAIDAAELQHQPRKPVFVFFPTVSTHMPFVPTPPLQPDDGRLLSTQPFDPGTLRHALAQEPDWTHMDAAYVNSVEYFLDVVTHYLRERADNRFVMIVLGDHQPAANVSGEGASWDVPVYVISRQTAILDGLQAHGFRPGLKPAGPAIGKMNELTPWLLTAFGNSGS
jgi:phosphatidylglycerophosphate synthase